MQKEKDNRTKLVIKEDEVVVFPQEDSGSQRGSISSKFSSEDERQAYEDHLEQIEEKLESVMIENQTLAEELKQYKENMSVERLKQQLEEEKRRSQTLLDQLQTSSFGNSNKRVSGESGRLPEGVEQADEAGVLPPETFPARKDSRIDRMWERGIDFLYNMIEDFNEMTRPENTKEQPEQPLSVKTLKENIRRFKLGIKPITDTFKGFQNLLSWKSRSYTLIVILIYMYVVWRGWFVWLLFFLGALRMVVNYLHFKGYKFHFAYLDPGEEKETDDPTLGLSDKFNLVILVATKVQNGLGSAADSLEKLKNVLTWRHYEGSKKILTVMCIGCLATAMVPTAYFWKFIGVGLGIKIFFINYIYNKYPKIKRKYDSSYRLWQTVPTDAEYDRLFVKAEMDKYIMVPKSEAEMEHSIEGNDTDTDSDEENSAAFRQVFSLPVTECPSAGWLNGKRALLVGKDRSIINLLSKKRGKLYLTNSFLCFERDRFPSTKNIVIPLQEISCIEKVKINQRLPGKGMAIQVSIRSQGKENILLFGGILGRDDVVKDVTQAIQRVKREKQLSPPSKKTDSHSPRRKPSGESISSLQNCTFGAYYEDSDED